MGPHIREIWANHTVHTINNAVLVIMGLMFGQPDYKQGIA